MYGELQAIFKTRQFRAMDMRLHALVHFNALMLNGLIELKQYAPMQDGEEQFEGGQTKQIKQKLKETLAAMGSEGKLVIEVKKTPSLVQGRETLYHFSMTQRFESKEEQNAELAEMLKDEVISDHSYPVRADLLVSKLRVEEGKDPHSHKHKC